MTNLTSLPADEPPLPIIDYSKSIKTILNLEELKLALSKKQIFLSETEEEEIKQKDINAEKEKVKKMLKEIEEI